MNLIIIDDICRPPTESLWLRYLTMASSDVLKLSVLIETNNEKVDLCHQFLRDRGLMDYVDDLIIIGHNEEGIRIDKSHNYPKTIVVPSVNCENIVGLLGQIKFLTQLR